MKNPFVGLYLRMLFAKIWGVHWWQVKEVKE